MDDKSFVAEILKKTIEKLNSQQDWSVFCKRNFLTWGCGQNLGLIILLIQGFFDTQLDSWHPTIT